MTDKTIPQGMTDLDNGSFAALCEALNVALREAEVALASIGLRVHAQVVLNDEATLHYMKGEGSWGLFIIDSHGRVIVDKSSIERRVLAVHALPAMRQAIKDAHEARIHDIRDAIAHARRFTEEAKR